MDLSKISNIHKIIKINCSKNKCYKKLYDKYKKHSNVEVIRIKYKSDNLLIDGFIFKKKNLSKKLPVVIYCRGGNNNMKHKIGELYPINFYNMNELLELIEDGKIICFASNYRGSRFSQGEDEYGGKDINDVKNLYPIIKKYKYSDEKNICVYGHSRGCIMTLILHKNVKWIKCIIIQGGVVKIDKKYRPDIDIMLRKTFSLTYKDIKKRSPINWIDKLSKIVPILILHGSADSKVVVENAYLLGQSLQKNKIPYKLVIYPGGNHYLTEYTEDMKNEIVKWIESYLLDNKQKDINLKYHN